LSPGDDSETNLSPGDDSEANLSPGDDSETNLSPSDDSETNLSPGDALTRHRDSVTATPGEPGLWSRYHGGHGGPRAGADMGP
jgi:hypothetical protein